jgi:hypothetical protein
MSHESPICDDAGSVTAAQSYSTQGPLMTLDAHATQGCSACAKHARQCSVSHDRSKLLQPPMICKQQQPLGLHATCPLWGAPGEVGAAWTATHGVNLPDTEVCCCTSSPSCTLCTSYCSARGLLYAGSQALCSTTLELYAHAGCINVESQTVIESHMYVTSYSSINT